MSKHGVPPAAAAWDVGARVAIFGAADSGRWATLGLLVRRALECGRAVVVADQGLDPLADQLDALADTLGVSFQHWPASQARTANRGHSWHRWRPGRAPAEALPAFEGVLWVDLPASGLDVAGFVEAVQGRVARADEPVVVVAHDLAWRNDADALLDLWDAAF